MPLIFSTGEAVFSRCLSSLKTERIEAQKHLKGPSVTQYSGDKAEFVKHIEQVIFMCSCCFFYKRNW